jgi:hypothetical protein
MSKEELRELINKISAERAKGFERKVKKKASSPLGNVSKDALMKLLNALNDGEKVNETE